LEEKQYSKPKTTFSAIQPSGIITLGNYLGALRHWINLQEEYFCIFALADLHTITVRQEPLKMRKNILEAYALLLACGIDLDKCIFFIQSHVKAHSELAWILNCYAQFGELARMTQFKDKSQNHKDNINAGLFSYPCLMAADILLYKSDFVPIGADQKQHVELTRNIAERFNGIYGEVFSIPEPYIAKTGAKIMSLQEPSKKMSKSDQNQNAWVSILDNKDAIIKKFGRAVTDSEAIVKNHEGKDGINNLISIYSCVTGKNSDEIEKEFSGKGYGEFKTAVAEAVWSHIEHIQNRFKEISDDKPYLEKCYRENAEKASYLSENTLKKVKRKIGFII
jgi:tryptophanyl-tRNA synthetase